LSSISSSSIFLDAIDQLSCWRPHRIPSIRKRASGAHEVDRPSRLILRHADVTVDAAAMHAAGHAFYQAANGVWLTDHVPPGDLSGWPG
jgi:hypothetical protein